MNKELDATEAYGSTSEWLLEWFRGHGSLPALSLEQLLTANYIQDGWIDSFTIISLIEESERTFSIRYNHEHFQEPRFMTVSGLAQIIDQLKEMSSAKK